VRGRSECKLRRSFSFQALGIAQGRGVTDSPKRQIVIQLTVARIAALRRPGPRVEEAETANNRSRASSQRDADHRMRLTRRTEFEQPLIILGGPLFVAVFRHGVLTIQRDFVFNMPKVCRFLIQAKGR
jgi:hypothetical protein